MVRLLVLTVVALAGFAATGPAEVSRGTSGVARERPAGTLLFVAQPDRLIAIDVESGRRTVRRVPAVAGCGPQLEVTGGHLFFAGVLDGRTVVYSVPATLDRPPRRLGGAHAFTASSTPGRVWLAGVDCNRPAMAGVQEVTAAGATTAASRRRVPGQWVAGAVERGLVLQRRRRPFVWDPRTGEIVLRPALQAVTDTQGSLLVGCSPGPRCDDLAIADARTGAKTVARPPAGHTLDLGAKLSPDGSLAAAPVRGGERWAVALVDTRDGATTIVPGSRTGTGYPELSWSASSGRLFIRPTDGGPIRAYRPGEPRAVTLPVEPPRHAFAFAAG